MAFSTYDPTAAVAATSTGYIDAHCTCSGGADCLGFTFTVSLAAGNSGSVADRQMTSGSNLLHYNLYPSLLSTTPWGSGASAQTVSYLLTNFGTYQRLIVYGQIRAQQTAASGTYSDSTAITITY